MVRLTPKRDPGEQLDDFLSSVGGAFLMIFWLAVFSIVVVCLVQLIAHANTKRDDRALRVASKKWGNASRCPDGRRIKVIHTVFDYPLLGAARTDDCLIITEAWKLTWPRFCSHIGHEVGHLMEYRAPRGKEYVWHEDGVTRVDAHHSSNPASIMYPTLIRNYHRCVA